MGPEPVTSKNGQGTKQPRWEVAVAQDLRYEVQEPAGAPQRSPLSPEAACSSSAFRHSPHLVEGLEFWSPFLPLQQRHVCSPLPWPHGGQSGLPPPLDLGLGREAGCGPWVSAEPP